jgi:hypothetical protein
MRHSHDGPADQATDRPPSGDRSAVEQRTLTPSILFPGLPSGTRAGMADLLGPAAVPLFGGLQDLGLLHRHLTAPSVS